MNTSDPPLARKALIRNCLIEIGIGFVAFWVIVIWKGRNRLSTLFRSPFGSLDFWTEAGLIAILVLLAACLLAGRDYYRGMKRIREYEGSKR